MLRVTATMDYAVRAAVAIARNGGEPLTASAIAQSEGMPHRFLATVLSTLRRSHVLHSRRGGDGGYWLSHPAEEITLGDLVRAVEGEIFDANDPRTAATSGLWAEVAASVNETFDAISLADLVAATTRPHNASTNPGAFA